MLIEKLEWRYATKKMDPTKTVSDEKIETVLRAIELAPTSSGLQPFEVIVVKNADIRAKLRAVAWNQSQVTDASHLLAFAAWDNYTEARIDAVLAQMEAERGATDALKGYYENVKAEYLPRKAETNFEHAARQAYIALGFAMTALAVEGVDSTPMEGFDVAAVDEILGLRDHGLRVVCLLAVGYREADKDWLAKMPKVRRPRAQFIREVN